MMLKQYTLFSDQEIQGLYYKRNNHWWSKVRFFKEVLVKISTQTSKHGQRRSAQWIWGQVLVAPIPFVLPDKVVSPITPIQLASLKSYEGLCKAGHNGSHMRKGSLQRFFFVVHCVHIFPKSLLKVACLMLWLQEKAFLAASSSRNKTHREILSVEQVRGRS